MEEMLGWSRVIWVEGMEILSGKIGRGGCCAGAPSLSSPSEAGQPLATGRQEAAGGMAGTWLVHPLRLSFCLCEMGINTVPIARGG